MAQDHRQGYSAARAIGFIHAREGRLLRSSQMRLPPMQYRRAFISGLVTVSVLALWLITLPAVESQNKNNQQGHPPQEAIKLNPSLVTVSVIVTDRYSRFVSGLSRQEFQLHEDGVPQEIASLSSKEQLP